MKKVSASSQSRLLRIAFACGAGRGNPDHETEQTRGVIVPLIDRARDLLVRGMRMGSCILLLQTLAECSSRAIRKARTGSTRSERRSTPGEAVLPAQGTRMTIFRRRSMR